VKTVRSITNYLLITLIGPSQRNQENNFEPITKTLIVTSKLASSQQLAKKMKTEAKGCEYVVRWKKSLVKHLLWSSTIYVEGCNLFKTSVALQHVSYSHC
jgi:hypothetical protein